ncbi:hypothetical protein ACLOJK_024418 [Asimina triloba]
MAQVEFSGGALRCGEYVTLRKIGDTSQKGGGTGTQQVVIEGPLSEEYYKIREYLHLSAAAAQFCMAHGTVWFGQSMASSWLTALSNTIVADDTLLSVGRARRIDKRRVLERDPTKPHSILSSSPSSSSSSSSSSVPYLLNLLNPRNSFLSPYLSLSKFLQFFFHFHNSQMASLSTHPFPTSFQLRLGFKSTKTSLSFVRVNFKRSGPRIRKLSVAASGSGKSQGNDKIPPRDSWTESGASKDNFSGWFDNDPAHSHHKHGFGDRDQEKIYYQFVHSLPYSIEDSRGGVEVGRGYDLNHDSFLGFLQVILLSGIVGVGLAGILFATGIAFASVSLSKRNSGVKEQMRPLTKQQEVVLTSEDKNHVDQIGDGHHKVFQGEGNLQNDRSLESETGTNQDSDSSVEVVEATSKSKPDENINTRASLTQNSESNGSGVDFVYTSSQDDSQFSPDVNNLSEPSGLDPSSPSVEQSHMSDSSFHSPSTEDTPNTPPDIPESIVELKDNLGSIEQFDLSVSATVSTKVDADHQGGVSLTTEVEHSNTVSNQSDHSDVQLPLDPSIVDSLMPSESDSGVPPGTLFLSKDIAETVILFSSKQDLSHGEVVHLPNESLSLPLEEHGLNAKGLVGTSPSVLENISGNEPDGNGETVIDRTRSVFESPSPENTFTYAGIPAPSLVSPALQVPPGKVLVPAFIDQVQGQALSALQVLKVVEADVRPSDLCTRREYARWLVSASSALSRNTVSKVYPAMYIENVTELAFDDVTPEDPDFPSIQGLAEAGLISSKLSRNDMHHLSDKGQDPVMFSPESHSLAAKRLAQTFFVAKLLIPHVQTLYQSSGFIDIDKINPEAWPAIAADMSAGEQGITGLAFGFTRLFQPDKPVTKAQAAIALATGDAADIVGEEIARIEAESMAETAVAAHTALVAQVEKDLNANYEKELSMERERIVAIEKLAEEARMELAKLRTEREEENNALIRGRAAVESETEVLLRLRHEVEEQLQNLLSNKMEIEFEKDRISKLRKEAESENHVIAKLQYELEVERKALSMARAWAEDEAKRAREHAKALEEARERWEQRGIKVVVDGELREDASAGVTWLNAPKESPIDGTVRRAENLVSKLKAMMDEIKGRSGVVIEKIIRMVESIISALKMKASEVSKQIEEFWKGSASKAGGSIDELQKNAIRFGSSMGEGAKRIAGECREGVEKITQKFKT